jgi:hypothetical protein
MPLLFATRSPPSPSKFATRSCVLSSSTAVVVCRCRRPPSLLSSSAAVVVHRHLLPPPHPSLPLRVSAVSHCPLFLSVPFVVCCPILHAVVIRRCRCPPLLSSSAATAIITTLLSPPSLTARSHPSPLQSTIQSCMSLSSATVLILHRCRPPLPYLHSSSLLQDVDCCIVSHAGPPQQVICDGINVP